MMDRLPQAVLTMAGRRAGSGLRLPCSTGEIDLVGDDATLEIEDHVDGLSIFHCLAAPSSFGVSLQSRDTRIPFGFNPRLRLIFREGMAKVLRRCRDGRRDSRCG
jgi:hypothetical protein